MEKYRKTIVIGISTVVCVVILYFLVPLAVYIFTTLQIYNQRIARSYDYAKITTPLPISVVDDLCSKFDISPDDKHCLPNAVAYGPDFFEDIETYFQKLPHKDATFTTVQDKLGSYLVWCENPDNDGDYRCRYDLRGDGIYPILVYFTKENYIYRIIANIGGS